MEWAQTGEESDKLMLDVAQTPLIPRTLATLPDVALNPYDSEVLDLPAVPGLLNYLPPDRSISPVQCAREPSLRGPGPQHPLRAFSLNGAWGFSRPDLLLDDGTTRIFNQDLQPGS